MSDKLLRQKVFHNKYYLRVIKWHRKELENELACTRDCIRAIQKNDEMIEDLKSCKRKLEEIEDITQAAPASQDGPRSRTFRCSPLLGFAMSLLDAAMSLLGFSGITVY